MKNIFKKEDLDLNYYITSNFKFILFIFFISFVIRFFFFLCFSQHKQNAWLLVDSDQYFSIAEQIFKGNGFSDKFGNLQFYRLPGYPVFLAFCFKVFGLSVNTALFVQLVISSIIPILVFILSLILFPHNILLAKIGSIVCAIHIGFVLYASMLSSESLFLIFFILFLIFVFKNIFEKSAKKMNWFWAGIFWGAGSLFRPVGSYVLFLTLILIIFFDVNFRSKIQNAIIFLSGWSIVVAWWVFRNFLFTGYFFFHALAASLFVQYFVANVIQSVNTVKPLVAREMAFNEWGKAIKDEEKIKGKILNEYERCCVGEKLFFQYALKYPVDSIKYASSQIFRTCFALYSAHIVNADINLWPDYEKNRGWLYRINRFLRPQLEHKLYIVFVYLEVIMLILIYLGLFLFFVQFFINPNVNNNFLISIPFILLFLFITMAYGCARLRLPIEPFLVILSCYFWVSFLKKFRIRV